MEYLKLVEFSVYPALWTLTILAYLTFALCFSVKIARVKLFVSEFLPGMVGKLLTFIFILAVLFLPILFGPFLSLLTWTLLFFLVMPERRMLPIFASFIFILWGIGIPLKEQLADWHGDADIQSAISVLDHANVESDQDWKYLWLMEERPDDVLIQISYSRYLRQNKQFEQALDILSVVEQNIDAPAYIKAERGVVAFLKGDMVSADRYFGEAEALGMGSAEFFFNYSKIKFDLMDVESSKRYFEKALARDRQLTLEMQETEDELGERGINVLVELSPPVSALVSSLSAPAAGVWREVDERFRTIAPQVPGASMMHFFGLGMGLLVCSVLIRRSSTKGREVAEMDLSGLRAILGLIFFLSAVALPLLFWPQVEMSPLLGISTAMRDNLPLFIGL